MQEFREAQNLLSVQATSGSVQSRVSWSPPSGLIYKLNFDTVVFEGISALGFRAISARGPPVVDNEEAEVLACRHAVEFAMEAKFRELIIGGDNVNVMKTIISSKANYSRLGHIYMRT